MILPCASGSDNMAALPLKAVAARVAPSFTTSHKAKRVVLFCSNGSTIINFNPTTGEIVTDSCYSTATATLAFNLNTNAYFTITDTSVTLSVGLSSQSTVYAGLAYTY